MATVYVKGSNREERIENFEDALKVFKRKTESEGIMAELRKREAYMKPGIKKRKKREAAAAARRKAELKKGIRK